MDNHAFRAVNEVARRFPRTIPRLNRFASAVASQRERVDWSHAHLRLRAARALRGDGVLRAARAGRRRRCAPPAPRSSATRSRSRSSCASRAGDDALLSPAHGRDSAFVAVHVFRGMAYEPAFREVEAALSELGGRPHWGKRSFLSARRARPALPALGRLPGRPRASWTPAGASPTPGCATCWDDAMKTFNIFEPSFEYDPEDPDGYHAGMDRFGPKIGAARIGASVYELPPGQALCPYHYESDEEWVLVLAGQLTVRHPGGEDVLGPGDVTCFPVGPEGAHKTSNNGTETVRIDHALHQGRARVDDLPGLQEDRDLDRPPRGARPRRGWARTSTTTTARRARGRSCPRRGRSGRCRRSRRRAIRCTTSKRSHSSPALAWRNHTRSPTRSAAAALPDQRRLDLARALAGVEPQARGQERARQPVAARRARTPGSRRRARSRASADGLRTTGSANSAAGRGLKAR